MQFIKEFLEREKRRKGILLNEFPNGRKYIGDNDTNTQKTMHQYFKPLDDVAIDKLQHDVNNAQRANYIFSNWYRDFFKITNGLNVFFGSINFYGEQTPMINHSIYGYTEAFLERDNPNWMAPYNLRFTRSARFDINAQNRWLTIGSYGQDGAQIIYDYKKDKIVAMYVLPVVTSIKQLRKLMESDYEQMIFAEWPDFKTFFISETERLSKIFEPYPNIEYVNHGNIKGSVDHVCLKKTLPKGHRDYIE